MNQNAGTHKRKVRTYSILAKVFLPVGLVLLILGIILLTVGIITFVLGLQSLIDSGACVQQGASFFCLDIQAGSFPHDIQPQGQTRLGKQV